MKKRFVGRSSASLANGRVLFPGDTVDLSAKEWSENGHLDEFFIDAEDPKPAPSSKTAKSDTKE